jgi:CheY-like chemotaxis protein
VAKISSVEALELFKSKPDQFDIIITDMIMPKMTGMELAREILQIKPGIPIIICTGFSEKINGKEVNALGIDEILVKPIVMRKIAQTIRKVLEKTL